MYSCKWGISARATFSSAQAQGTARVIVFFECVLFIKLLWRAVVFIFSFVPHM